MQWQQEKPGWKSRWQIPRCRRCSQRRRSALERPLSSGMRPGFSIPVWAFPCYKTSGKSHHPSASPSVSSLVKWAKKQPPNFTVGGGQGNPLQYPCLENLMDKGAWWAADHRVEKSQTQPKQLCVCVCVCVCVCTLLLMRYCQWLII